MTGLYGAARSASLAGDLTKARTYYAQLIEMTASGDGSRPEIKDAKAFAGLAGR